MLVTPEQIVQSSEFKVFIQSVTIEAIFFDEAQDIITEASYRKCLHAIGDAIKNIKGKETTLKCFFMSGTYPPSFMQLNELRFRRYGVSVNVGLEMCPINRKLTYIGKSFLSKLEVISFFTENVLPSFSVNSCSNKMLVLVTSKDDAGSLCFSCSQNRNLLDLGYRFGYFHSLDGILGEEATKLQHFKNEFISADQETVNCLFVTTAACSGITPQKCTYVTIFGSMFSATVVHQASARASRLIGMPEPILNILHCEEIFDTLVRLDNNSSVQSIEPGLTEIERQNAMYCIGIFLFNACIINI